MRRRDFAVAAVSALFVLAERASAQRTGKLPRIGYLSPGGTTREAPFWQGMRDLGYVDGKSMIVDRRSAEGDYSRLPALAEEIVKGRPDVIVAAVTAAALAAKRATATIPIVMTGSTDPVAAGLVANLARPGGNVTGTSTQTYAAVGKVVELVRQVLPKAGRALVLWNPENSFSQQLWMGEMLIAAARQSLLVRMVEVHGREDLERAFLAGPAEPLDAVLVPSDTFFNTNAPRIAELALARRLPVFGTHRSLPDAGTLASYGPDVGAVARRAAPYVHKILKGARPGDLAIELPTKFELVLNERTAKAIGVAIPPAVTARADEVIR